MINRSDNQLRSAITVLEGMLHTEPSVDEVLMRCLNQLMIVLGGSFGFAYQCQESENGRVPWSFVGCYRHTESGLEEVKNTSTSRQIPQDIQAAMQLGRCVSNNPLYESGVLPHVHPAIKNYIVVPLVGPRNIYAVLYICNSIAGFGEISEFRIRPFVGAANCLLHSAQKTTRFKRSEEASSEIARFSSFMLNFLDAMFNAVLLINEKDEVVLCNSVAADLLKLSRDKISGMSVTDFLPNGSSYGSSRLACRGDTNSQSLDQNIWRSVSLLAADGVKHLVDLSAFEFEHRGEMLRGLVMEDISERLQSASEYHSTLQRFQVLTNLAPVGILQLNRQWECIYVNDTWCEYCQMTPDENQGIGWIQGLHIDDSEKILQSLRFSVSKFGVYESEFRMQTPLGKITWVKANACPLYDEKSGINGLIMTVSDITDHLNNEQRLRNIAEHDQLTGLVNRTFFHDRVVEALKGVQRYGAVVMMFVDLDNFKHVNDSLGHDAGDTLLKEVAQRLRDAVRKVDSIARIGGDEFTLLLTNVYNSRAITAVADKIITALEQPFDLGKRTVYITCSIGIALAEEEGVACEILMKQADIALYKAKKTGKNQYRFYTPELDKDANTHMYLRQSLKEKGRDDFRVVYQPQVDARNGKIVGLEALVRWDHPEVEDTEPEVFIKMIEESGLIQDFSDWLFDCVFRTMSAWRERGVFESGLSVSINLSAKQFRNKNLAAYIGERVAHYGIDPAYVVFEVTETVLIEDPDVAFSTLKKLKRQGFSISLDDFGTGYSSLAYLRDMPLHTVKIDRSFITDVINDADDGTIVSAIIELAGKLRLEVVAEGVNSVDVKQWLLNQGCHMHQGYYFYKPLETADVEKLLDFSSANSNVLTFNNSTS